jgi:2-polyprenyl-6-methoxyphenol hydroxylase-like FAD-dependent oxidoreductase
MNSQVLVVGAGPVGLTMAAELARYGVSVRLVDRNAQRTDKSKALVLWSRTLELLDRGASSAPFVAAGLKVDAANIVAGSRLIGHISLAGIRSIYPYALMLPQSDTERLLEERLNGLGVRVERHVEMTSFTQDDAGVRAALRGADGREEIVETQWLIGCDGAHSAVRHGLGLPFLGETLQSDWILADLHLTGMPFPNTEIATYWHEDGVLAIFPIAPGRCRIIAEYRPLGRRRVCRPDSCRGSGHRRAARSFRAWPVESDLAFGLPHQ